MSRLIEKDGKHFRMRRGKLVQIPAEWVGKVCDPQTIRKRPSKTIHKLRKTQSVQRRGLNWADTDRHGNRNRPEATEEF